MTDKTCATCDRWRAPPGVIVQRAPRAMGTCALGGPDPDQGCSDTAAGETCPQHVEKHHA